jgi:peptidoglycan/xylan/chitin deacetylase (PgdA/CDA1 family)
MPLSVNVHKVILTFDDGPDPEYTPRILDLLAEESVPAVFFVRGKRLRAPGALNILRRAASEGHLIGNHTFSHPNLTKVSPEEIRSQIMRTHELISEFEPQQRLLRPPYGACDDTVRAVAEELNYRIVLWSVDSEDWKVENQSAWVDIAVERIAKQHLAICLCHDSAHTAEHLPQLLQTVKQFTNHRFVMFDDGRGFQYVLEDIAWKARVWWAWLQGDDRIRRRAT